VRSKAARHPKPSARAQHAVDLGQGRVGLEPVKCLCDRDEVDGGVAERDALGGAFEDARRRGQQGAHLGHGLDGDDSGAALEQRTRELPRPGGQVQHRDLRRQAERLQCCRWIAGPPTVVFGGGRREPGGGGPMDHRSSASIANITRSSRTPWRRR
jgi:hypothetical protein